MRILFILGAGASYGSVDCAPKPPPLGPDLYDALCAHAPAFAVNTNDFSSIFKKNLEEGMDVFVLNGSGFTPFITKIMAAYFYGFNPGTNNLYIELIQKARASGHQCIFATLNYDLLLERSAAQVGLGVTYGAHAAREEQIPVIEGLRLA